MSWMQILRDLGVFGVAVGALAYLAKALTAQVLGKDLEAFKIRYSKLYADRAAVIRDLYVKLCEMEDSLQWFFAPFQPAVGPPMEEKRKIAAQATDDFLKFYFRSRIYLSQIVCDLIDKMNKTIEDAWKGFTIHPVYKPVSNAAEDQRAMEKWTEAWNTIKVRVPDIKHQLENEFRRILGSDSE